MIDVFFLSTANAGIVFVGADDKVTEGTFLWIDGTPVTGPWGPGQPNNLNEQDCMVVESAYGYNFSDVACSTSYKFLCQTPFITTPSPLPLSLSTISTPAPTTPISPSAPEFYTCQEGYTYYSPQGICWKLETNMPLSWEAARSECNNDGGDLLVIQADDFLSYIQAEMTTGKCGRNMSSKNIGVLRIPFYI